MRGPGKPHSAGRSHEERAARAVRRPDSVAASTEPNRHVAGATDSLFAVHYSGLTVQIRKPRDGNDMVSHARVTDNQYLAYPRIGIGAPADRVIEALGQPTSREDGVLVYSCGMGAEQPVKFELADSVVRAIVIEFYVD